MLDEGCLDLILLQKAPIILYSLELCKKVIEWTGFCSFGNVTSTRKDKFPNLVSAVQENLWNISTLI